MEHSKRFFVMEHLDEIQANRQYRLILDEPSSAACYLQGVNDATHGIGDPLLSVVACRAGDIVHDILAHRDGIADRGREAYRMEPLTSEAGTSGRGPPWKRPSSDCCPRPPAGWWSPRP
jgi:lysine/ornithine N-monooxygenase